MSEVVDPAEHATQGKAEGRNYGDRVAGHEVPSITSADSGHRDPNEARCLKREAGAKEDSVIASSQHRGAKQRNKRHPSRRRSSE